jgi:transposase
VPKSYPPEFRRRVLALVEAGRPVAQVAAEVGISGQAIYGWRRQQLIDSGRLPGLTSAEHAELVAARNESPSSRKSVRVRIRGAPHGLPPN